MALFQNSVLKKYLSVQEQAPMHAAFGAYLAYFHDPLRRANIRASKEEQFQEGFLRELFVNILGYTINPDPDFNLTTELKNIKDSKKTDGAIIKDGKAIAVIELKGTDTKDLEKIRDQAFNYKNNHPDCIYVITSNFEKLRFYIHNAVDYVEFSILQMQQEEFRLLWLLLQKDNLLKGIPQKIKAESLIVEELVTKKLYSDYSAFKQELWQDMVARNPGQDELLLYKKSQKLLDRFLFIFFAEDKGLLPPNSISEIVKQWDKLAEMDEYRPLYDRFKKYFGYMNTGRVQPGKAEIHAYNGGLFAPDPLLDSLKISDTLLKTHVIKLTEYDFESEVDTNILGHIFEHSLNDIENVRASLEGTIVDKSKTKRKKDGVFYTPKYITKYIVDNTVGKLCTEKKTELGIIDEDFAKGKAGRKKDTLLKLVTQLKAYREWLLQLAICDPACGSGAFLNQVLEFLMAEHRYLDELESMLFGSSIVFPNVENHILENNIFGVDINEESVEIARLSLWLRTAQKGRKLSTLSSNIKVGNSLIDDPEVAGDLAFNWQDQFPKVFAKGGFDVVVGNPPYVRNELLSNIDKSYLLKEYKVGSGKADLYVYFFERAYNILVTEGIIAFIVSSKYTKTKYGKILIEFITQNTCIEQYIDFKDLDVFDGIIAYPSIIVFKKSKPKSYKSKLMVVGNSNFQEFAGFLSNFINVEQDELFDRLGSWNENSSLNDELFTLFDKLKKDNLSLFEINIKPQVGIKTGSNAAYIFKKDFLPSDLKNSKLLKPYIIGRDVKRYSNLIPNQIILFPYIFEDGKFQLLQNFNDYNNEWRHLERNKEVLSKRAIIDQGVLAGTKKYYEYQQIKIDFPFDSEYIIYPDISLDVNFTLAKNQLMDMTCFGIPSNSKSLLGILNSNLIKSFLESICVKARGGYLRLKSQYINQIPIPNDFENFELDQFVSQILQLKNDYEEFKDSVFQFIYSKFEFQKVSSSLENWPSLDFKGFLGELAKAKVKLSLSEEAEWMAYFHEQKAKAQSLQSDITRLDREIDALVYKLYGLTEEEIRIVEGN